MQKSDFKVGDKLYSFFDIKKAAKDLDRDISKLPYSLKILLENMIRNFDNKAIIKDHIISLIDSAKDSSRRCEIAFSP